MPPEMITVEALVAVDRGKKIVCKTNDVDPAVPMSNLYLPVRISRGENESDIEPNDAPVTSALLIAAAASTHFKCWARNPGLERPDRILSISKGWLVRVESVRAVLNI